MTYATRGLTGDSVPVPSFVDQNYAKLITQYRDVFSDISEGRRPGQAPSLFSVLQRVSLFCV